MLNPSKNDPVASLLLIIFGFTKRSYSKPKKEKS